MKFLEHFHQLVLAAEKDEPIAIDQHEIYASIRNSKDNFRHDKVIQEFEKSIEQLLNSDGLRHYELDQGKKYFALSFFITQDEAFKSTYRIFDKIIFCTRDLKSISDKPDNWIKSIELAKVLVENENYNNFENDYSFKREKLLAESFLFLKTKKFQVSLDRNYPFIHFDNEHIILALETRAKKLGSSLFDHVCRLLEQSYLKGNRFYFPRQCHNDRLDPIGLLFNLSINNLHSSKDKVGNKKVFKELRGIALHYSTILDIQEFSQFELIQLNSPKVIENLTKLTRADQIYSIDQCNPTDVGYFLDLLCDDVLIHEHKDLHNKCVAYRDYFKRFLSIYSPLMPLRRINISAENHNFNAINECLRKPRTSAFTLAVRSQPIVQYDTAFSLLPLGFFGKYFIEPLLSSCREQKDSKNGWIGDIFENIVGKVLTNSGLVFRSNEEYEINHIDREYLKVKSTKGECDFIVETDKSIIFIETKTKPLTTKSRLGDDIATTTDMLQSFIFGLTQTNTHRILLQRHGELQFKSKKSLKLDGRKVYQISLSLDNYMALHDSSMTRQLINTLIRNNLVVSNNPELQEKLNKLIGKLTNQYSLTELQEELQDGMFLKTSFYSIFHFISLLKTVKSNIDFETQLNNLNHISYGTKDVLTEMGLVNNLKAQTSQITEQ
jgi:hypothetical protein